ncbi:MAG: HPr(Ser) kinase/phosphatase [bacterium]|nr:HPr(Ser) kinase/phosphatase [bacterium]
MTVEELSGRASSFPFPLVLLAGEAGLSRKITSSLVQRPGVALAGFMENFHPDRIQVIGRTEIDYLFSLPEEQQKPALARMLSLGVPAVMVATQERVEFPPVWKELFELAGVPVFFCQGKSREVIATLSEFLEEHLSEKTNLHGVLLEILELGVLVMGRSGIGKSESALDLVNRGHRLVADDLVEIRYYHRGALRGRAASPIKYHMEIRGVGIINIQDLFGVSAIREEKEIDLIIELVDWEPEGDYDRLGLDDKYKEILGAPIPYVRIPVSPGRNIATIIEVAARNQLLKNMGHYSARRLDQVLSRRSAPEAVKEDRKRDKT